MNPAWVLADTYSPHLKTRTACISIKHLSSLGETRLADVRLGPSDTDVLPCCSLRPEWMRSFLAEGEHDGGG